MAKRGTYTTYQKLTPIQEDFAGNLLRQEQLGFKYREEQRQQQEAQRKRNEQLAKQAGFDLASVEDVITGVDTIDQINYMAVAKARDQMGDIYRQMMANPKLQSDVGLQMRLSRLRQFPKLLKDAEAKITTHAQEMSKGFADGSISEWDRGKMKQLSAFFGTRDADSGRITPHYMVEFDAQGNAFALGRDEDGDLFKMNVVDIVNGYEMNDFTPTVPLEKETSDLAKNLGDRETSRVRGGFY